MGGGPFEVTLSYFFGKELYGPGRFGSASLSSRFISGPPPVVPGGLSIKNELRYAKIHPIHTNR